MFQVWSVNQQTHARVSRWDDCESVDEAVKMITKRLKSPNVQNWNVIRLGRFIMFVYSIDFSSSSTPDITSLVNVFEVTKL